MSVTEVYQHLKIEQAIASHHLRILKSRNIVDLDRDGKNSLYYLTSQDYYDILKTLTKVI